MLSIELSILLQWWVKYSSILIPILSIYFMAYAVYFIGLCKTQLNIGMETALYLYSMRTHIQLIANSSKRTMIINTDNNIKKREQIIIYIVGKDRTTKHLYFPITYTRYNPRYLRKSFGLADMTLFGVSKVIYPCYTPHVSRASITYVDHGFTIL